ncbi:hypothetical protein [Streptomyces sp. NPDC005799]|uniref:hypothetical protein n=1 Tax=Streptomyces sp. NPDC005799 TaxID=3154678 RepID=UPI0033C6D581
MMRETPFPRPMTSAEARELWQIIGRVMADSARDVASRTGIPPQRLVKTVARDLVLRDVTEVFLRANERGALPMQSSAEAHAYLTHALLTFVERGRATVHPAPPHP